MIRKLFEHRASHEAELLAEAQALLDDGLDLPFVLGLFPDEADWLEPLLAAAVGIEEAYAAEPASYYFEASLKSKFLGAAREPRPVIPVVVSPPAYSPFRTAVATMSVASTAAALGILTLGFVTASDSVPGDWNYAFKLANERFEYTTSRGESRIDVQFRQTEERIHELKQQSDRGNLSESQFERVQREFLEIQELARRQDLDAARRAQLEYMAKSAAAVLNDAAAANPDFAPSAAAVAAAIEDSAATALATPPPTPTAPATPSASPTAPGTAEPGASPSPAASETPTPGPTATEEASPSASPTAEATSTELPSELETPSPSPSSTP